MNILYTNFHTGGGGGHTTYILSLVKNTPNNTYVACPESSSLCKSLEKIGYKNIIKMTFYYRITDIVKIVKNARLLARHIEEYDIDIVHTNGSPDNRMVFQQVVRAICAWDACVAVHQTAYCFISSMGL